MMTKRGSSCGICESVNLTYTCTTCINSRLNEIYKIILVAGNQCNALQKKLEKMLMAKAKANEQKCWRHVEDKKVFQLKEKLKLMKNKLTHGKAKLFAKTNGINARKDMLDGSFDLLQEKRMKLLKFYSDLICTQSLSLSRSRGEILQMQSVVVRHLLRVYPLQRISFGKGKRDSLHGEQYDQICGVRLPRASDPHSVPPDELSASLGYMLQFLNLVACYLYAPLLLTSGFAASCSRVWQRASYWDSRPFSQSHEHPLFIPRQNSMDANQEGSGLFGVASMESPRIPNFDSHTRSQSVQNGVSVIRSPQTDKDVRRGILLLKKSVLCVTEYCFNVFSCVSPIDMSTVEAFAEVLAFISSKEARNILSLKETRSSSKRNTSSSIRLNDCVADSKISLSSLEESKYTRTEMKTGTRIAQSHKTSFLVVNEVSDAGKNDNLTDEWDIIERPTLPPPPSHAEDVEHWTRAMIIDAKKM